MAAISHNETGHMNEIDPDILKAQSRFAGRVTPINPTTQSPAEMRRLAELSAALWNDGQPALASVTEHEIAGLGGAFRARCYATNRSTRSGAILFLHGGGWMFGSVDTHDRVMRCLAVDTKVPVIGIDYRLAPENPFPAALEDCQTAFHWLSDASSSLNIDPKKIAIVGDSAGANLALSTAIAERGAQKLMPAALVLFYGCFAPEFDSESYRQFGDGRFGLTTERVRCYWSNYLDGDLDRTSFLSAPLHAPLDDLPPTYVSFGALDPLADDSRKLADRLGDAGVTYRLDRWPGAVHGFLQMTRDVELARRALAAAVTFLRPYTG
jgi:acetyl esterase